jgi:hypothetical protein
MEQIEEILCATYERKIRGPGSRIKGITPIHITINVEPTTPCATNTPERTPTFRQSNFSGRREIGRGLIKKYQLGDQVQEVTINYLHRTEAVVQHSSK